MPFSAFSRGAALLCAAFFCLQATAQIDQTYARDAKQTVDQEYTQRINKYTTLPELNSPLTDYLPASSTVPTPMKVLGDVSGAPDILPYAEDVYSYFRLLESATPRVKVFTIGHTEEGREMIAVAVADESLLKDYKENDARLAKLADPRTINMNDATAEGLVKQSVPVYYITGTIHSPETGAPTALMELAYRLAVDNSPYIKYIRTHMITLITPVVEVDGRDRMVDVYKWHKAHPNENYPRLVYWGHYVAHDNNRDAMTLTLNLSRNVLDTYINWHAQVLHDLHESVPFLYDNTVGDEPYNAWLDPILTNEWQMIGWNNVQEMTKFGMPGVFTHGNFDTWSPGYLMFLAAMHNGISRLYETFGNGGADTVERILTPDEYSRTWYRQNPPYPKVKWSQRDNNNYEETALLVSLNYFAQNGQTFLNNFYLKSKRSILKPNDAGPAAYVLSANEESPDRQRMLLDILRAQHVEISRTTEAATATVPVKPKRENKEDDASAKPPQPKTEQRTFPAGSYVIRMDQPYSRIADALLDRQYWAPNDPQKTPYDDTGWSLPALFSVEAVRVTDAAILKAPMQTVKEDGDSGSSSGSGSVYLIANHADPGLITLRYLLKNATVSVTDAATTVSGQQYPAGSLIIQNAGANDMKSALQKTGLVAAAVSTAPSVAAHTETTPRIAMMHSWLSTQTEGWWRQALDKLRVPFDYISTQTVSNEDDLRSKYDVILFAPVGNARTPQIIEGLPMWGNELPWKKTDLTPNLGRIDSTDDMRPGLGYSGIDHLRHFVEQGGLLITSQDTAQFAIDTGLAPGVSVVTHGNLKVVGTLLATVAVDQKSPILNGYSKPLTVYSEDGLSFNVSNTVGGTRGPRLGGDEERTTGRGGPDDPDTPQGRPYMAADPRPHPKPWEAMPLNEDQTRNNPNVIPAELRPQVVLRFADKDSLLVSGLLDHGELLAQHATVVAAHLGKGSVLLFANNPIYRGETIGSYPLVFNAILNFDRLGRNAGTTTKSEAGQ
ncbi:M14 family zinc carboxypeptidase [Alloacidobacterium sp.]|uniref:M14 family zinc carboxypeptidase n=1 Tax=Alloacidobacterium sp. TaxID=2951999 RepID=UPI002D72F0B7|nr:M14 family zinc carboxypeptidase [Alloacidobacterium sp.]HYK35286.1 M14 family zinc carboxypeptidase [Alloacidobacterium sp.]